VKAARVPGSVRPPEMGVGHIGARRLLLAGWLFDRDGVQLSRQELEARRAREREQLVRKKADRMARAANVA
jgi:hypothetical protein